MKATKSTEHTAANEYVIPLPRQTPGIRVLKQGKGTPITDDATPRKPTAKERGLAGTYRLIHGRIAVPRTREEMAADPDNEHPMTYIQAGAIIEVDDEEAVRLVDAGLVEPASVPIAQSKLGLMWQPPVEDAHLARMRNLESGAASSRERFARGGGIR